METPDFEQIARGVARPHCDRTDEDGEGNLVYVGADEDTLSSDIAKALRLVWNARGAADIAKLDVVIGSLYGLALSEKPMKSAIRELDR